MELGVDLEVFRVDLYGLLPCPSELRIGSVDELESPPHLLRYYHVMDVLNQLRDEYLTELSFQ